MGHFPHFGTLYPGTSPEPAFAVGSVGPDNPGCRSAMSEQAGQRLLIVDDANLLRELIRDGLRKRFPAIEVIEARNVAEGYHQVSRERPRLVLLDVSMPDGDGLALARRIRDEWPRIVVCICTLHDEPEFRQAAAESGAAWFIAKQGDFWSDIELLVRTVFEWSAERPGPAAGPESIPSVAVLLH